MRTWNCLPRVMFNQWLFQILLAILLGNVHRATASPEPGKWEITFDNTSRPLLLKKAMYKDTDIQLKVVGVGCPEMVTFTIQWYLKFYPCQNELRNIEEMYDRVPLTRGNSLDPNPQRVGEYIEHIHTDLICNKGQSTFAMLKKAKAGPRNQAPPAINASPVYENYTRWLTEEIVNVNKSVKPKDDVIASTWKDGPYLLVVSIKSNKPDVKWNLTVNVIMKGSHGFISVTEWPLMIFYMVMCIAYILYALLWFVWAACYWKDLLRIQFWIAGVIFLGMVEKAVFCAEYENTNAVGSASQGLLIFAELLSSLKRTLARLLVIIVSLGYGIIKPRLGTVMHRVIGLGVLYFAFASIEGVLRITGGIDSGTVIITLIILAVFDSCFLWFISLHNT